VIFEPHPLDAWAEQTAGEIEAMTAVNPAAGRLMDDCATVALRGLLAAAIANQYQFTHSPCRQAATTSHEEHLQKR
jgi:hypothetical protein